MKSLYIILILCFCFGIAKAQTRYVSNTGTDVGACPIGFPCATINYAITQAVAGDVIDVAAGTYPAAANINKSVIIEGPNKNVLSGNILPVPVRVAEANITGVLTLAANNVTINGLQFTAGGTLVGEGNNFTFKSNLQTTPTATTTLVMKSTATPNTNWEISNNRVTGLATTFFTNVRNITGFNASNNVVIRHNLGFVLNFVTTAVIECNTFGTTSPVPPFVQNAVVVGEVCASISILNNTFQRCANGAVLIYAGAGTDATLPISGALLMQGNVFNASVIRIRAQNILFTHSFITISLNKFISNPTGDILTTGLGTPTGIIEANANSWTTSPLTSIQPSIRPSVKAFVWLTGGNVDTQPTVCGYQPDRKVIFTLAETPSLQDAVDAVPIPPDTNYWELIIPFSTTAYTSCITISRPLIFNGAASGTNAILTPTIACNQAILINSDDVTIKNLDISVNGLIVPAGIYSNGRTRLKLDNVICELALVGAINFVNPEGLATNSVGIVVFGTGTQTVDIKRCIIKSIAATQFQRGIWIKNMNATIGGALPTDANTLRGEVQSALLENIKTLTLFQNNQVDTFSNGVGLYIGGCTNISVLNNTFTAFNTAVAFTHIRVNSGWLSTQVGPYASIVLNILSNTFNNAAINVGIGVELLNANKGIAGGASPDYTTVNIGTATAGTENTFNANFRKFIRLSPIVGKEYSDDVQTAFNKYDLGAGLELPSDPTMTLAKFFILEDKIDHKIDFGTTGFVSVIPNNSYVTINSFEAPFTTTPSVQRAVNATPETGIVNINTGVYPNITTITKNLTFNPSTVGIISLNTLVMNGPTKILNVTENLTITNALTLTDGIIKNPNKTIILPNTFTTLIEGNGFVTGFVEVIKILSSTYNFTFPVGDEINGYKPFKMNSLNGSGFDIVVSTAATAPTIVAGVQPVSCLLNRHWIVLVKTGTFNTPINFVYTTGYNLSDGIDPIREPFATLALSSTNVNTNYTSISTTLPISNVLTSVLQGASIANNTTLYVRLGVNYPAPVFTILGSTSVCEGGSISLTINNPQAGAVYNWTGVSFTATGTTVSVPSTAIGIAGVTGNINVTATDVGGCPSQPAAKSITVIAQPVATFSYSGATICKSAGTATPTATLNAGSNFTATPAGLSINATTGVVNLTTSTSATYIITHDIPAASGCTAVNATFSLTISELPASATITSPITTICTSQNVVLTCTTTGLGLIYQWKNGATPVGTNSTTFSATTAGSYTVEISNAVCTTPIVSNTIVMTVVTQPVATFSYSAASLCKSVGTATPTATINAGSNFTATPAGLSINATTGVIDLTTSTSNTYLITHDIPAASGCTAVNATFSLTISELPATATITSPVTSICSGNSVILTCTTTGVGLIYQWKNGATNVGINADTFTATVAGSYTVEISNAICTTPIVSNIIVLNTTTQPVATFSYSSTNFCKIGTTTPTITDLGGVFTVVSQTAGVPNTGLIINASTGVINLASSQVDATTRIATYEITYTIAAANGCNAVTSSVIINVAEPALPVITASAISICTSTSATLTATIRSDYSNYSWRLLPSVTPITSGPTATSITVSVGGTYELEITNPCGTQTTTVVITAVTQPVATVTYPKAKYCSSEVGNISPTATISANSVFSVAPAGLTINATTGVITIDANTQVDANFERIYTITHNIPAGTSNCNPVTATFAITIYQLPIAKITNPSPYFYCSGEIKLTAETRTDYQYQWKNNGTDIAGATSATLSVTAAGNYTVVVASGGTGGCSVASNIVVIQQGSNPVVSITPTLVGVQGQTLPLAPTITAPTGQEKYEWLPNDGSFSDNTILNPVFTFTNNGTYTLTVRVGEGCVGTASFTTTVNADVYLPNAFFPESTTLENQTLKIYGFGISELEFKVYDRLGKLVYQTTDIAAAQNVGWDGKYNGQNLPNGAYVWYLSGKKINGDELKFDGKTAGTVMLMK